MTNEDLERARESLKFAEGLCVLLQLGDHVNLPHTFAAVTAAAAAEFRAEGEREVFERLLGALDAWVRNRFDITVAKVVYMAIDYLKAAFPEYAKTEEQCPGDSQPSQS
jgi:hypothetical protein